MRLTMLSVSFKRKETDLMDKRDITVEKKGKCSLWREVRELSIKN